MTKSRTKKMSWTALTRIKITTFLFLHFFFFFLNTKDSLNGDKVISQNEKGVI